MIPATTLVPVGLLWYGWSAEQHLHWVMPDIGVFIVAFGITVPSQCIQCYVLDCYPVYASSAIGSLTILRAAAGGIFPLFGPVIFRKLGYGVGSTLLAGIAATIGGLVPILLMYIGPSLRAGSPYAAGFVEVTL